MAKEVKIIIDVLAPNSDKAAGEVKKSLKEIEKEAERVARSQEQFNQRRTLQQERLAAQAANVQKKLDQQSAQFSEQMAEKRRQADERASKAAQKAAEQSARQQAASQRQTQSEVERINAQTRRNAEQNAKLIERAEKSLHDVRVKEWKRSSIEIEKSLNQTAQKTQSAFSSAFKGGFIGGAIGSIVASATSALSQIPTKVREVLDESVKIATERQNAMLGLASAANFAGIGSAEAQEAVKNLRLVRAGVLDLGDATTGLKSLLASGFSLPQAIQVLERFSDAAAFGKQSALSYGEAISRAAEGIKNQNSALVDNVGLTKNLSVILKERGFELEDLTDKTKKQAAIEALYKGILAETTSQIGDADKLTQGYTGSTAALEQAQKNLNNVVGEAIIQSPQMLEANKVLTEQINKYTSEVQDAESETAKFTKNAISQYAQLKGGIFALAGATKSSFEVVMNALGIGVNAALLLTTTAIEGTFGGLLYLFANLRKQIADTYNYVIEQGRSLGSVLMFINPGLGAAVQGLPNAPTYETPKFSDFTPMTNMFLENIRKLSSALGEAHKRGTQFGEEFQRITERIRKARNSPSGRDEKAVRPVWGDDSDTSPSGDKKGGGRGRVRKDRSEDTRTSADIAKVAKALGFEVGTLRRGNLNAGSLHSSGKALDIRIGGKSDQDIAELIAALLKAGFRVVDERRKIPGVFQTGPHIHSEVNDRRESTIGWHPSLRYGNIPIGMLRELDAQRFKKARGGVGTDEVEKYLEKQSDELTKAAVDRATKQLQYILEKFGMLPSEQEAKRIADLRNRDLKKQGRAQIGASDVISEFRARPNLGVVTDTESRITTTFLERRKTFDEEYIDSLRKSLNIDERRETLIYRKRNAEAEIKTLLDDQLLTQEELTAEEERQAILRKNDVFTRNKNAGEILKDLQRQLETTGQATTVYSETVQRLKELEEVYGNLDPAKKQDILNTAGQIDATNKFLETQEKVQGFFESIFDDAFSGRWKSILDNLLDQFKQFFAKLAAQFVTSKVMQFLTGQNVGGTGGGFNFGSLFGGGQQSGSGGILQFLTGGFGGGNPAQSILGGGGQGGGLLGSILGMFGGGGGASLGAGATVGAGLLSFGASSAAGMGAGIGGGLLGAGAGLAGLLGGAGAGAGGLGAFASGLMPLMTNPWTIGIAAAALGGYALWKIFGGESTEKKLKKAAESAYSIRVNDKNVLKQLKGIGEGVFGRGQAGKKAAEVVQLEQARELLLNYAESTGQNTGKLEGDRIFDASHKSNNYNIPPRGSSSAMASARNYFSSGSTGFSGSTSTSGRPSGVAQVLTLNNLIMQQLSEAINTFNENFAVKTSGVVVADGLKQNPAAAADAMETEYQRNPERTLNLNRNIGGTNTF